MRKKLDTRFPAARIKKIMQADEDVGKIALAVPVLVSKALELFLQDLCDRTYDITLQRGAKTMSSLHLKHCVQSYNVFDFLRDIVSKVPDYGHADTAGDDRTMSKRRKAAGDEYNESDEENKRSRMHEMSPVSSSGRGRGTGRGRGRGRGRAIEREPIPQEIESDPCTSLPHSSKHDPNPGRTTHNISEPKELVKDNAAVSDGANPVVRNFDLNANVDEDVTAPAATTAPAPAQAAVAVREPSAETATAAKHEEYPGWSLSEMDRMTIDPVQLAHLNSRIDEEEDYDEEG